MPINYILVERGDPRDFNLPKKFYAQSKSKGEITLRELSKKIASISTVSPIDTIAVLEALLQVIPEELADSNIVRLGDFGSFYTTAQSSGAEKEEDFNDSLIKKTVIRFRPGTQVNNILKNAKYKKITE